jgi:hypothetical protein
MEKTVDTRKRVSRLQEFLVLIAKEEILELTSETRGNLVARLEFRAGPGKRSPHMQLNEYVSEQEAAGLIGRERSEDQTWCLMLTEAGTAELAAMTGAIPSPESPKTALAVVTKTTSPRTVSTPPQLVHLARPLAVAPAIAPDPDDQPKQLLEPLDRALANFLELAEVAPSLAGRAFWAAKAAARQLTLEVTADRGTTLPVSAA